MGKFDLIAGQCPVCATNVEHEVDGVVVRFTPHDDPDVCRAFAQSHAQSLRRVIDQASEERAVAQYKERHYRHAYGIAVKMLYELADESERYALALKPGDFEARIEAEVRKDNEDAKLRQELIAMQMKRGDFTP